MVCLKGRVLLAIVTLLVDTGHGFHSQVIVHSTSCRVHRRRRIGNVQCRGSRPDSNGSPEAVELASGVRRTPTGPVTRSRALRYIMTGLTTAVISTSAASRPSLALESDEFEETFDETVIGIELQDVRYKGSSRVLVKRVVQGGAAASRNRIKPDMVVVSANGVSVERESAVTVKGIIKNSPRPLTLVFRDTSKFNELLRPNGPPISDSSANQGFEPISTRIAPEGGNQNQEEQVLKVLSSEKNGACTTCRGVQRGDLLEIEYTGTLENGSVFDGSSITVNGREVVGRGGDKTLFFVLGKQPKGQFPPGWDLLLVGMCVGETRVISVPPILGYGDKGMPQRGVPPNATLLYDVKLIGVNGVNMCAS